MIEPHKKLFSDYLDQQDAKRAKLMGAAAVNMPEPDAVAESVNLGQKLGLPSSVVIGSPEQFRKMAGQRDLSDGLANSPRLADWFGKDTMNGALAKDDLASLTAIEAKPDPLLKPDREAKINEAIASLQSEAADPATTWARKVEIQGDIARLQGQAGETRLAIAKVGDTEDSRADQIAARDVFATETLGDTAARRGQQVASGATDVFAALPEQAAIMGAGAGSDFVAAETAKIDQRREIIAGYEAEISDPATSPERKAELTAKIAVENKRIAKMEARIAPDANADLYQAAQDTELFAAGDALRGAVEAVVGAPDPRDNSFWGKLAYGGGNMAAMAASAKAASVVGGPAGALAVGGIQGAALNSTSIYKEALAAGATEEEARRSAGAAAIIGASEIIPIGHALRIFPSKLRERIGGAIADTVGNIIISGGEEALQESLATIANNILAQTAYDPDRGWADNLGESALIGAILGGALGGVGGRRRDGADDEPTIPWREAITSKVTDTLVPLGRKIASFVDRTLSAGQSAAEIARIDEAAAASKLKQRAPDKFEDFVANARPDEAIYVDAEGLQEYYQTSGRIVDDDLLISLGIEPETFAAKVVSGGDVAIPVSAYAARVSGTDDATWFRDNGVMNPDEAPMTEADEFNARVREIIDEARAQEQLAQEQELRARDADVRIYDAMFSQLRAAGRSPDVAGAEAAVWGAFFRATSERANIDPESMAKAFGIRVEGPATEETRRRNRTDIDLNTLRSQGVKALKPKGDSLAAFVKKRGGVADTGGDLASMDLPKGIIGARRGEQRDGVLGLDDMGRAAIEAGYFPELTGQDEGNTANLLLDALAAESRGELRFPPGQGPDEALTALYDELNSRGIDLSLSNDEIMAALEGGETLNQDPLQSPGWEDVMLDVETETGDTAEVSAAEVEAAIAAREEDARKLLECLNG